MTNMQLARELLNDLYPGNDDEVEQLRKNLARVASFPSSVVVLLDGPPGSGKTTMARTLAVCRRLIVASSSQTFSTTTEGLRQEVLSEKPLTWYRDISLAGLVDSLAEAQLFGIGKKVATEVAERVGIFEQAMTGHIDSEQVGTHEQLIAAAKEKQRWTPLITGGVVLLDEIGDLGVSLQGKLLRVLNNEKQYRVGKEGNDAYSFHFSGMTIVATWRNLGEMKEFRQDLWQRISQNPIRVPSLSAYSVKSRLSIVRAVQKRFQLQIGEELARLEELGSGSANQLCDPEWLLRLARLSRQSITGSQEQQISELDWHRLGEFRALRNVVLRTMMGETVEEANSRFAPDPGRRDEEEDKDLTLLTDLLSAESLSAGWRQQRIAWAKRVNDLLVAHSAQVEQAIEKSGKLRRNVKKQLENLSRLGSE